MEPTVTENKYKSFKYSVVAACYNVMDMGYRIGALWGVECKDKFSWSGTTSTDVCPFSAYLLSRQPTPIVMDYTFNREDWDNHEIAAIVSHTSLPESFVSAVVLGYQSSNTPWRDLLDEYYEYNDELEAHDMPLNFVENEENFRLGIKLGKFLASHFGIEPVA